MTKQQNIFEFPRTTGDATGNAIAMDDLTDAYKNGNTNSNLLTNVSDAVSNQNTGGFVDGNTTSGLDDYEYDQNGNMIKDRNKGIESITYNHLNLPTRVNFLNNKYISYRYNAAGQKLQKVVNYNDSIKTVDYLDGFQYAGKRLQFFPHPEGYVKVSSSGENSLNMFNYVYNYTVHLGNIRVSYSKDPQTGLLKILDESHYYPFGLKHQEYVTFGLVESHLDVIIAPIAKNPYQYKYNGKEFQDELNLNLYDYGARNYDPALGRWMNMDPLAEEFYGASPYNYVANDPIGQADFDGRDFRIDVIRDKNDNITGLHFSATVYIQGSGASMMKAHSLNKEFDENNGKAIEVDGIKVSVDVNYIYDEDKTKKDLKAGENLLTFSSEINDEKGKPLRAFVIGNIGQIYNSGKSSETIFHESFHFMGLSDRYDDYTKDKWKPISAQTTVPHTGFENDIMGGGSKLSGIHYQNWVKHAKLRSKFGSSIGNPFSIVPESYFERNKKIDKNSKGQLQNKSGNWYKPYN